MTTRQKSRISSIIAFMAMMMMTVTWASAQNQGMTWTAYGLYYEFPAGMSVTRSYDNGGTLFRAEDNFSFNYDIVPNDGVSIKCWDVARNCVANLPHENVNITNEQTLSVYGSPLVSHAIRGECLVNGASYQFLVVGFEHKDTEINFQLQFFYPADDNLDYNKEQAEQIWKSFKAVE